MTPAAVHLEGLGLTSGSISESRIQTWIDFLNEQWGNSAAITTVAAEMASDETYYDLNGRVVSPDTVGRGVYIVKAGDKTSKIIR